ncbi:hypothetical protein NX059_006634 [Plenodomus lindquistii]|nr:hypothetical protein NX059_006634 [Plenodomus lindquistii]
MDKAKAAITDFMGRSGHHDTTVHEAVAPAVTQETIKPHVHEEVNTAIDKEVHQDHYHRTIQPVQDREVLPEKHEARLGAVQHREFDHRDHDATKRNLVAEQAQFKDERRVEAATHSQSVAPVVGGEHVHHHIHETIQPVVQKETIQPSVIHTTVPIHEVHHNKATHHETTALPAMTMDQFKAKGGSLTGREERYDEFEGVPKNIGSSTAGGLGAVSGLSHKDGHHSHGTANPLDRNNDGRVDARDVTGSSTTRTHGTANPLDRNNDGRVDARDATGSSTTRSHGTANPLDRNNDGRVDARDATGSSTTRSHGTANPLDRNNDGRVDARDTGAAGQGNLAGSSTQGGILGNNTHSGTSHTGTSHTDTTHKKPSLMDKLNPKVDADGDGKAGFMK